MPLAPEQAQKITDLRVRMLSNVQAGRPAHANITAEEINESLSFLRQNKSASATAAAKRTKTKAKAPARSGVAIDTKAFTDLDLD